jgi:hypothetical protein
MTSPTSTGWLATPRFCCPWRKEAGRGCVLRPVAGPAGPRASSSWRGRRIGGGVNQRAHQARAGKGEGQGAGCSAIRGFRLARASGPSGGPFFLGSHFGRQLLVAMAIGYFWRFADPLLRGDDGRL